MVRNLRKTCNVCFKSMRGDHLKRHMMRMDHLMGNNEGTGRKVVNKQSQIRYTDEKFIAVKKRVFAELEEFDRKMELGRYVKLVVDKHGVNENGLGNDTKEALKTYELHGKNKEEDIYKCTYCGNWKADSVLKCIYCGNLSFEKTNVQLENMMNKNVM